MGIVLGDLGVKNNLSSKYYLVFKSLPGPLTLENNSKGNVQCSTSSTKVILVFRLKPFCNQCYTLVLL